ncbi:mitogen-activated protein kinase, partial [Plutella xylostella]
APPKGASDVLVTASGQPAPPPVTRLTTMTHMPWHHGAISRERAEALLSGSSDGVFLVRESTNFPGDHTLCVRYRGRVEHYR